MTPGDRVSATLRAGCRNPRDSRTATTSVGRRIAHGVRAMRPAPGVATTRPVAASAA